MDGSVLVENETSRTIRQTVRNEVLCWSCVFFFFLIELWKVEKKEGKQLTK